MKLRGVGGKGWRGVWAFRYDCYLPTMSDEFARKEPFQVRRKILKE